MGNTIRRTHLIGMPVIDGRSGEKVGEVKDIAFVNYQETINGIVVILDHWIKREIIILRSHMATVGEYAVVANDYMGNYTRGSGIAFGSELMGVRLIREDGHEIGKVSDIFIDRIDWTIKGYEFSLGVIDDLINGRGFLPQVASYSFDNNALVVSSSQYEDISYCDASGIKNIFFSRIK